MHIRYIDSRAYTMSYSNFDAFYQPTTTTYPDGAVVTTSFDHEGENTLVVAGPPWSKRWATMRWDSSNGWPWAIG